MRQIEGLPFEVYSLGLIRHAVAHGDQNARAAFQQSLEETVLTWLHDHPSRQAACSIQSEKYFVTQAFKQFWHIVLRRQLACETLSEVLMYLRVSLNSAIMETLRTPSHPKVVTLNGASDTQVEELPGSHETWNLLQTLLPNQRERRLAYLFYHCGLEPAEIMRACPQEWSDLQEIYCLRRIILERLTKELTSEGQTFLWIRR